MPISFGTVIKGRYEVLKPLATDPLTSDWLAFDCQDNGPVMLRAIVHTEDAGSKYADHVRRQSERLNRLRAPCLVHVQDMWAEEDTTYVAMEPVPGWTVADVLRERGPLSSEHTLAVLRGAATALEHLCKAGLPHGDIAAGALKVVLDEAGCASAVRLFEFAGPLKLPYYTAPEQADGSAADIAGDIYALGVLCWEMLTAPVPFDGETAPDVSRQHRDVHVPSIGLHRRDLSEGQAHLWEQVLQRCLAKDRQQRFSSPSALLAVTDEITQQSQKETVQSRSVPTAKRPSPRPGYLASLVTRSGRVLPLSRDKVRVGRNSGDIVNDIDLGPEEGSSTVHRRHLRLERRGDQWYVLLEPGAKNPTTVAGRVLSPGRQVPIRDGDEIRVSGVSMVFHVGSQD